MKIIKYILWLLIMINQVSPLLSQERHELELIINTKNTNGATVVFHLDKYYSNYLVWDPDGYITTEEKIVDPDDVTITGDTSGTDFGWDGNCSSQYSPWMGRIASYRLWVQGKSASLEVDCYGIDFLGDYKVIYYYDQDKFKNVNNAEITEINLYDDPSGLQPTAPENLTCTNPDKKK